MTECERIIKKNIITDDFLREEVICDYMVSTELKKVWAVELDLLSEFKRVCKKHGLKWYATSGTLLGAIRHNGFIPWDDDLDVCMPRQDYDKLTKIYADEFNEPYFLQTPYTDKEYCYSFAKLRNSNTSFVVEAFIESPMNQGIYLDIFPLEQSCEEGYLERREKLVDIIKKCSAFMSRNNNYIKNKHTELAALCSFKADDNIKLYEEIQQIASGSAQHSKNYCSTEVVTIYKPERKLWPQQCFNDIVEIPFCNTTINAPKGWDQILKIMYGNYMDFPPIESRGVWHSNKYLNTDISYKTIRDKCLEELKKSEGKL